MGRRLLNGRLAGGVMLTPWKDKDGYVVVRVSRGKRRNILRVHLLVLRAFRGSRPPKAATAPNGKSDNRAKSAA